MSSEAAIRALIYEYAHRMDSGDLDGVCQLLEHAELRSADGHAIEGSDYLDHLRRTIKVFPDGTLRTRHLTTNVIVEVDEASDTATARSYVTVLQKPTERSPLLPIFAGGYFDRFAKVDGSWQFSERTKLSTLPGDLSDHLLPPEYAGTAASAGGLLIESALRQVLHGQARASDRCDWAALADSFTRDATISMPDGSQLRSEDLIGRLRDSAPRAAARRHEVSTVVVEIDEESVVSESYLTASSWRTTDSGVVAVVECLRSLDEWEPGARWRVRSRRVVRDMRTVNGQPDATGAVS
jgi:ketosteroid isomerase-like protein